LNRAGFEENEINLILLRGGGDLASGVALRLHRVGFPIVILELPQPLAVRRTVSFAEAVYEGACTVEGVTARLVSPDQLQAALEAGNIPVLVDPTAGILNNAFVTSPRKTVVVDARLTKQPPEPLPVRPLLHIGLGPGFRAGENCDAVIETRRSHTLGRVFWSGAPQPDSGQPEGDPRRVLRAPVDGIVTGKVRIGDRVEEGEIVAAIDNGQQTTDHTRSSVVRSPFRGVVRGLIHDGLSVAKGMKIGDVDPRGDPSACHLVSDKALAVGGGVLEAILSFRSMVRS
jgi:xanthine dehydrogenase accessory factor